MLTILCLNCKQNQQNNKILIDQSDQLAICPHCQVTYFIDSGFGSVSSGIQQENIEYTIQLNNKQYKCFSKKRLFIKSGSSLTLIQLQGKLIAIADHSRQLWFPIHPIQRFQKTLNYLRYLLIGLLFLQTVIWSKKMIELYQENPLQVIAIILTISTLVIVPTLIVYKQRRKKSTIPENLRIEFSDYE